VNAPAIALIAAVARNGAIGSQNALPWRLSGDLRRFKALTLGKPLLMGRKTFQSIGAPLPGRDTIVVTRDPAWSHPGAAVAHEIAGALQIARQKAHTSGASEIFVAGGGEVYAQTIDLAERLYITEVDLAPAGDTRFPTIDRARWREARREPGVRGPRDEADFVFVDYVRTS
jgi:dihydrofolate reductase